MTRLYLVRHGKPRPDERANEFWELAPDAGEGLAALRASGAMPDGAGALWFSSPEPKALGTALALTDTPVEVIDGLREMVRPRGPWLGAQEWAAAVRASVSELDVPAREGWERGRDTTERVVGAFAEIRDRNPGRDLVLVGHGTAWTLLISALTAQPPDFEGWQRMGLPDVCALDLSGDGPARVVAGWSAWC